MRKLSWRCTWQTFPYECLGVCEGAKEDKSGWGSFIAFLKYRGLKGVRLLIPDKCIGLVESLAVRDQEDRGASIEKAEQVMAKFNAMKLSVAAKTLEEGIQETLTCTSFPQEHRENILTNNLMERIMREIRRQIRVADNSPDGRSALMFVPARLRYIAGREWETKRYMDMDRLAGIAGYHVLDA